MPRAKAHHPLDIGAQARFGDFKRRARLLRGGWGE
jgi:hypothetical protein